MIKALKKPGKIPTYLYKSCDLFLETVTVCVNEALKAGFFHDSLKCANEALKADFSTIAWNAQMLDDYTKMTTLW